MYKHMPSHTKWPNHLETGARKGHDFMPPSNLILLDKTSQSHSLPELPTSPFEVYCPHLSSPPLPKLPTLPLKV
jgi:hypothetical protein